MPRETNYKKGSFEETLKSNEIVLLKLFRSLSETDQEEIFKEVKNITDNPTYDK